MISEAKELLSSSSITPNSDKDAAGSALALDVVQGEEPDPCSGSADVVSELPKLPPLDTATPPITTPIPPTHIPGNNRHLGSRGQDDRLEDIHARHGSRNNLSSPYQTNSLRDAFASPTIAVPKLLQTHSEMRPDASEAHPSSAKKKGRKTKTKTVKQFMVAKQQRQQDRIADDYAAMLYQTRSPTR